MLQIPLDVMLNTARVIGAWMAEMTADAYAQAWHLLWTQTPVVLHAPLAVAMVLAAYHRARRLLRRLGVRI